MDISPRARAWLALLVTALALTQVIGAALGSAFVLHLGMALGFAPLPRPFGGVGGYESFAARHTLTLVYEGGETDVIDLHTLVPYLQGPHRAKIAYLQGFTYMPTFSLAYTNPLARRVLCEVASVALSLPRPMRAELIIQSDTAGWEDYKYVRSIACTSV